MATMSPLFLDSPCYGLRFAVDLDNVMVKQISEAESRTHSDPVYSIHFEDEGRLVHEYYVLNTQAQEFIRKLREFPNTPISFISGRKQARNKALLNEIRIGDQSLMNIAASWFSFEELPPTECQSDFDRMLNRLGRSKEIKSRKKDFRLISPRNPQEVILFDDMAGFMVHGQDNLVWVTNGLGPVIELITAAKEATRDSEDFIEWIFQRQWQRKNEELYYLPSEGDSCPEKLARSSHGN